MKSWDAVRDISFHCLSVANLYWHGCKRTSLSNPEHLLMLASQWVGQVRSTLSSTPWDDLPKMAKDADNLLAADCSIPCFGMARIRLVEVWKCEEGKVLHQLLSEERRFEALALRVWKMFGPSPWFLKATATSTKCQFFMPLFGKKIVKWERTQLNISQIVLQASFLEKSKTLCVCLMTRRLCDLAERQAVQKLRWRRSWF